MKKIGIGIDTGGTFTDGVVYDFQNKKILASAKSLTTKQDLTIGIQNVLEQLPRDLVKTADIVGLSTTLATNACVENKGGRAKLLFLGGDKNVVDKVGKQYGFRQTDDIYYEERVTNLAGEILHQPDWDRFTETVEERFGDCDGVGVIEIYAMRNGGVLENKAKEIIQNQLHIPVTCGNELYSDLGSLQRGASALLNARLIPVIDEFLKAVRVALDKLEIKAPIIIMRSDGTTMSEQFAQSHPVETLLCGPAASVIGASFTTEAPSSVIVDMGGTTTDIALVKNGKPVEADDGISVGQWKTYVKGLYVDTFGLGGDTAIRFKDNKLTLDRTRVIPLCVLATDHPEVTETLKTLAESDEVHFTRFLHEWYCLIKDIEENPRYTEEEKQFCRALKKGPLILSDAAKSIGKDIYSMNVIRLEEEGVVIRAGLTPTDIMHLKGDFEAFDRQAAHLGAVYVAKCLGIDVDALCEQVYEKVKRRLYRNIVRILLENSDPYYKKYGIDPGLRRLIDKSYHNKNASSLSAILQTPFQLIGVGAPIHVFLPDVAKHLGTTAVIPEYASVTNAVGAVAGNVSVRINIPILPAVAEDESDGYMVYGKEETIFFHDMEAAIQRAIEIGTEQVTKDMRERGEIGDFQISHSVNDQTAEAANTSVYLGTTVSVWA